MASDKHYLERELYELVRADRTIFDFLESCLDGVLFWDLETREDGWLSPAFNKTLGYAADKIPNKTSWWRANIHPDDLPLAQASFKTHSETSGSRFDETLRYRHKSGSTVWLRSRGLIIRDGAGQPKRMLAVHTDITAEKRADQELLERNAELLRSNTELEKFADAIAHDVRAPLRAITGFGDLLVSEAGDELSETAKGHLDHVLRGAVRLQTLVEDLLSLARIDGSRGKLRLVDLNASVANVLTELESEIASSGAEIDVAPLPTVLGHGQPLFQLFYNLIENAIKFTNGKPTIAISVEDQSKFWRIEVRDEGIGVEPQFSERIFEIFQRLHTRSEYSGTGIGLAVCRKVAGLYGGTIDLAPDSENGARFWVRFPKLSEP